MLVAISKGMLAVKLCTNKILMQVDLYIGHKTSVVVVVVVMAAFLDIVVKILL